VYIYFMIIMEHVGTSEVKFIWIQLQSQNSLAINTDVCAFVGALRKIAKSEC